MSSNTPISPAGVSIGDLRELVKTDLRASNELQQRIDQLHEDANEGRSPSINQALMGIEHKRIGKDLVLHIEQIEAQGDLAKDDREMLQQLTARLAIHDLQSARLAQYRDLQLAGGRQRPREWLETEKHPSEAQPSSSRKRRSTNTEPILEPWAGLNTSPSSTVTPQPMPAGTTTEDVFPKRSTFAGEQAEYDEDGDSDSDDQAEYYDEEPNVNKSTWPLLYRIIGIDPETPEYLFGAELDRYDACPSMTLAIANVHIRYKVLAMEHHPKRLPNDSSASERWAVYSKAYEVLRDPERKRFYDMHKEMPKSLEGLDISKLNLDDGA